MPGHQNPHIAVLGDRKALAWVLESQRIAFPEPRYHHLFPSFTTGDVLYLYTTRGCFKNPTRDKGRIIGIATVAGDLARNPHPVAFGGRDLPYEAPLRVESLTKAGEGVDLSEHAADLSCFPKPDRWSVYLRRSVLAVSEKDAKLLDRLLKPLAGRLGDHLSGYQQRAASVLSSPGRKVTGERT